MDLVAEDAAYVSHVVCVQCVNVVGGAEGVEYLGLEVLVHGVVVLPEQVGEHLLDALGEGAVDDVGAVRLHQQLAGILVRIHLEEIGQIIRVVPVGESIIHVLLQVPIRLVHEILVSIQHGHIVRESVEPRPNHLSL